MFDYAIVGSAVNEDDEKKKEDVHNKHNELQKLLTTINKRLSDQKKYIQETRNSQVEEGSHSQTEYQGLLKEAKRLLTQQKRLVNLFKVHKEIAVEMKAAFPTTERCVVK